MFCLLFFFVQCFTIIIIKCKALFSCHSSSFHYSTQGFVLISFHFIFSFLISISGNVTWTRSEEDRQDGKKIEVFIFLFLFVNSFVLFVVFFLYSVLLSSLLNARLCFSCHSSSFHYSTQGFVLISFHFIFSFLKDKKIKILCNFTCDLLPLRISDLKCGQTKNSQANGSLRENVSVLFNHTFLL